MATTASRPAVGAVTPAPEPTTIAAQAASPVEHAIAMILIAALVVASVATFPFHAGNVSPFTAFIPAFAGTTGLSDALTAILLFALFRIDGSRVMVAAATAYLIDALLILPYALTFPNVVTPTGFIGNEQSAAWLWLVWHVAFPFVIIAGVRGRGTGIPRAARTRHIGRFVAGAIAFAAIATLVVTLGRDALPTVVHGGRFAQLFRDLTLAAALANVGAAIVLVRGGRPLSTLSVWLVVAVASSAIDASLNAASPGRFSLPWYVGKLETFVTASVVMLSLLGAWASLYARSTSLSERLSSSALQRQLLEERLAREHAIAVALQQASLPRSLPVIDGIDLHAIYRAAVRDIDIGGDWYDAFVLADGRLVMTIGDVAGKGLPASLVMGKVRQSLRVAAQIAPSPAQMLAIADRCLQSEFASGFETLVTAFVGILDEDDRLVWASAGHSPPLVRYGDGRIVELYGPSLPLGLGRIAPAEHVTQLETGSLLVAFTDGLVESTHDLLHGTAELVRRLRTYDADRHSDPTILLADLARDGARDDVAILTMRLASARGGRRTTPGGARVPETV